MNSRHAIPAPPSFSISAAARLSLLVRAHTLYQAALSPLLHSLGLVPGGCRFQPTCSQYATLAIAEHGWLRGLALSVSRLLRCHPLARGGWDPVAPLRAAELAAAHPASSATGAPAAGTIDMPDSTHDPA